jgi:ABC-type Zn uptake system ZnuABC Zn-binding protein ZnuA
MKVHDLPDLRRVAKAKSITYSGHAFEQMLNRGISSDDIEDILKSNTNQLIETQSPSTTPGKMHKDERNLIYDPNHNPDAIIVIVLLFNPFPEIRVVTVELPDSNIWEKHIHGNPALTRK